MKIKHNKFGSSTVYEAKDFINRKLYIFNVACLTIQAEVLGWANCNQNMIVKDPNLADDIIVLGCQVTDLSILNDFNTLNKFKEKFPYKRIFIGGCLAMRFDIKMPENIDRVDFLRSDYQPIYNHDLITWQTPYWIPDYNANIDQHNFLRKNNYPLRISVGCHGKCSYCTIRITRGDQYELSFAELEQDIKRFSHSKIPIVAIADTLSVNQIYSLYQLAIQYNVKFALRNIEPVNALNARSILIKFAELGLLDTVHIPIQSDEEIVLKMMNRDLQLTNKIINLVKILKSMNVKTGTNIIIDYNGHPNTCESLYDIFDHISINPYWDGKWNIKNAQDRMNKYIPNYKVNGID